jgi:hypothetical protein
MKIYQYFFTAMTLLTTLSVSSQELTSKKLKKMKIQDYSVMTGFGLEKTSAVPINDFKTLAPESVLLTNNFSDYQDNGGIGVSGGSMFSILLGFKFLDTENKVYKGNPNLRMGISYMSGNSLNNYLNKTVRKPYDTLTSAQTGQTAYIDSLSTQSYGMNYRSDQLRLDASLIYRTNTASRWSLYAGAGVNLGLSTQASTQIIYNDIQRTETRFPDGTTSSTYYYSSATNGKVENFRNKTNFGATVYVPMGIDFRVGKKNEFLKNIHLFYDLRSGFNVTSIPELKTFTSVSMQHGLGVRIKWN